MKKNNSISARLGYATAYLMLLVTLMKLFAIVIIQMLDICDISCKQVVSTTLIGVLCIIRLGGN